MEEINHTNIMKDFMTLVQASTPIIVIKSYEETRVLDDLQRVASSLHRDSIKVWKRTTGLVTYPFVSSSERNNDTMQIERCLDFLLNNTSTDIRIKEFYILLDIHPYIEDSDTIRFLKDISQSWSKTKKTLILISSNITIPDEISKEVAVCDYILPSKKMISSEIIPEYVAALQRSNSNSAEVKIPAIEDRPKHFEALADAFSGLTREEIIRVSKVVCIRTRQYNKNVVSEVLEEKKRIVKKSGLLEFLPTGDVQVGGLKHLQTWAIDRGKAFSDEARDYGLPYPKGVFLLGVPGTGKTLFAKMLASMWGMPALRWDVSKMFASLQGQTESNVSMALQVAEACSPCVLVIDEVEKAFSGTGSSNLTDGGTGDRVMGQVLSWLQDKTAPVFVIATANGIKSLPPEFMRKGRFDELFFVGLPDAEERLEIFGIHLKKRGIEISKEGLAKAVENSANFSGAEIESAVISSQFLAFSDKARKVELKDILESLRDTKPIYLSQKEVVQTMLNWANERARIANAWAHPVTSIEDLDKEINNALTVNLE